jgi:hypothetical protein
MSLSFSLWSPHFYRCTCYRQDFSGEGVGLGVDDWLCYVLQSMIHPPSQDSPNMTKDLVRRYPNYTSPTINVQTNQQK